MIRFFFWFSVLLMIAGGLISLCIGKPIPPANVWQVAGGFVCLYAIAKGAK